MENKTALLIMKSSLPEDVAKQLWPQGSRPLRLYALPKIHKEGSSPLRPIISTIGATIYSLTKHLADLLGQSFEELTTLCETFWGLHPHLRHSTGKPQWHHHQLQCQSSPRFQLGINWICWVIIFMRKTLNYFILSCFLFYFLLQFPVLRTNRQSYHGLISVTSNYQLLHRGL
jgi:hypothetical protein